jgi:hypothetical protein
MKVGTRRLHASPCSTTSWTYTKADPKDRAVKRSRPSMRQERREHPKQEKPEAKGNGITEEGYDPRIS